MTDYFPRTEEVPLHSPIFFAEHKDRYLRQLLIKDIQKDTGRKLCVFFNQARYDDDYADNAAIDYDDIERLHEVCEPAARAARQAGEGIHFDLMIETNGGNVNAAEAITAMLRQLGPFNVIVPYRAKSAGTEIALAAKSIYMGPTSNLGPIEPQFNETPATYMANEDYERLGHGTKDAQAYFLLHRLAKDELARTEANATKFLREHLGDKAELDYEGDNKDTFIKYFQERNKRNGDTTSKNSKTRVTRLDAAVAALCGRNKYRSHGSVIDADEAVDLGINVVRHKTDDLFWRRIIMLHAMCAFDLKLRGSIKLFEGEIVSRSILPAIKAR